MTPSSSQTPQPTPCAQNFYSVLNGNPHSVDCQLCPSGYRCDEGTRDITIQNCGKGYYCYYYGDGKGGRFQMTNKQFCRSYADSNNKLETCTSVSYCSMGSYCNDFERYTCPAGKYCDYFHLLEPLPLCSKGYYCPEGSSVDKVENCGYGSTPEKYYCPEGTPTRLIAQDTTLDERGEYTIDENNNVANEYNRVGVLPCPDNKICKNGNILESYQITTDVCDTNNCTIHTYNTSELLITFSITNNYDEAPLLLPYTFILSSVRTSRYCSADTPFNLIGNRLYIQNLDTFNEDCNYFFLKVDIDISGLDMESVYVKVYHYPMTSPIVIQHRNIALGDKFVCWLNNDNNYYGGSIGCDGGDDAIPDYIAPVSATEGWIQITAGGRHLCGLSIDNQVKCWGSNTRTTMPNYRGHFPENNYIYEKEYMETGLYKFKAVKAFLDTTCVIHTNGKLQCWGLDYVITHLSRESDYYKSQNIVDISFYGSYGCSININNQLKCLGNLLASIVLPIDNVYGVSLFDNSACVLFIPEGSTYYAPMCFGGLYRTPDKDYNDFSTTYNDINHIMQGDDFVCFISRTTYQASCLGDVRDYSPNGNDWNIFSDIYVTESCVTQENVMHIDLHKNIKLYGAIINYRNSTIIDSIVV